MGLGIFFYLWEQVSGWEFSSPFGVSDLGGWAFSYARCLSLYLNVVHMYLIQMGNLVGSTVY